MASTTITRQVTCPMHAGTAIQCGELVEANFGTFRATTVRVAACTVLVKQGWPTSTPQMVVRKSEADERLTFAGEVGPMRHTAGLVTFG